MKQQELQIRTPEGIVFSLELAGPFSRFLAWFIDNLVVFAIAMVLGNIIALLFPSGFAGAANSLAFCILVLAYSMVLEWFWRGLTVGKRVLGLRVVDAEGLRLRGSQIVIRNLMRLVDFLPALYLVGGLAMFFSRHAQRLGDFAANTVVVSTRPPAQPDIDQIMAGKFNSFREYPHLEARFRQRVSPAEANLALHALMRRDDFEPQERIYLFHELAEHLRQYESFPEEAVVSLTDEQYLRNAVDVLFRPRGPERPSRKDAARQ